MAIPQLGDSSRPTKSRRSQVFCDRHHLTRSIQIASRQGDARETDRSLHWQQIPSKSSATLAPADWGVTPAAAVYQFIPTGHAATDNSAQIEPRHLLFPEERRKTAAQRTL
jgi:hypothetical protein